MVMIDKGLIKCMEKTVLFISAYFTFLFYKASYNAEKLTSNAH